MEIGLGIVYRGGMADESIKKVVAVVGNNSDIVAIAGKSWDDKSMGGPATKS